MKIFYVCNDLEYFIAHRLKLALQMREWGHDVVVAAGNYQRTIIARQLHGIEFVPTDVERHNFSLLSDIRLVANYRKILKRFKPDVVHTITIKPNLYTGISLLLNKILVNKSHPKLIMTFAGLGKVFEPKKKWRYQARKMLVVQALKLIHSVLGANATFENAIDRETMVSQGVFPQNATTVLMGAGIDRGEFYPAKKTGEFKILFASRLIKSKGIDNFITAAIANNKIGAGIRFLVAGARDQGNPDCIEMGLLQSAIDSKDIKYLGEVAGDQMAQLLREVDVFCLPTRLREGFPRVLLEAAACGCALISSNQPVMRQIVIPGKTGWLLDDPCREQIECAFVEAGANIDETRSMGVAAAKIANKLPIDDKTIAEKMLEIYSSQ